MQKFFIKNRKKRKYTKKIKPDSLFLLPNAFFGFLPLLIILLAFMATYFMSNSFKASFFYIKYFFELSSSPAISISFLLNLYRNISFDIVRFTTFSIHFIGTLFIASNISLVKLNTFLINSNKEFNLYFFIKPFNTVIIFSNSFGDFVFKQSTELYISTKNISISVLYSLANDIDHINFKPIISSFSTFFNALLSYVTQISTITVKILLKSSLYSDKSLINTAVFTRGLCFEIIYFTFTLSADLVFTVPKIIVYVTSILIPPTISASKYFNYLLQSYSTLIYHSLIVDFNSV